MHKKQPDGKIISEIINTFSEDGKKASAIFAIYVTYSFENTNFGLKMFLKDRQMFIWQRRRYAGREYVSMDTSVLLVCSDCK